jgi:TM2 domain-containing membrane protein YozV
MKSTKTAYLLWALGFFGCLGLHQFYLKNTEKGILYILTAGGFGFAAFFDFFNLRAQVKAANQNPTNNEIWAMQPLKERDVWVDLYEA